MSDQEAEKTSGETGSHSAEISHSAEAASGQVAGSAETAKAADAGTVKASDASAGEPAKAEAEAAKPEISSLPGKVIVMPRGERAWDAGNADAGPEQIEHQGTPGKRRIAAIAANKGIVAGCTSRQRFPDGIIAD